MTVSKPLNNHQLGLLIGLAAISMFGLALFYRRLLFHIVFK